MEINLSKLHPDIRFFNDMRKVLYDQEFAKNSENIELYYMYRGIKENNGIRYDITVIPARMLGKEFSKTKGHYHSGRYQEVYTVLEGQAIYLLQKKNGGNQIQDAYSVRCNQGETIVIPPDYGHVTINPSRTEQLTMGNWIYQNCKSDYSLYEKLKGACYYYTDEGWVKNDHYKNAPPLRFEEPLKEAPKDLSFLRAK